jgi:hypothetical protein
VAAPGREGGEGLAWSRLDQEIGTVGCGAKRLGEPHW